jgi:hypothetical protein
MYMWKNSFALVWVIFKQGDSMMSERVVLHVSIIQLGCDIFHFCVNSNLLDNWEKDSKHFRPVS